MDGDATWRELILEHMKERGDEWGPSTICTLDDEGLDEKFYSGFGGSEGKPFTLWTDKRVYFPVVYDGAEWVGSAPRFPDLADVTKHIGGE